MANKASGVFNLTVWGYVFMFCAYVFLAFKLATYKDYQELTKQWGSIPASQFGWLAGVFLLLPINWLLETFKWQLLTAKVQKLPLITAYKSVLVGISTGFFTPNRVGEMLGRLMFLSPENRKTGVTLSLMNSLTQNLIMTLCGIPACWLFMSQATQGFTVNLMQYLYLLLFFCVLLVGFYFGLPKISSGLVGTRILRKLSTYTDCLKGFGRWDLLWIMAVSLLRYLVFFAQFYLILQFWNVPIALWHALIAIPTTYLLVTFTPSFAFSEAAIRSSYAVLIIGAFSDNVVGITLAGVSIWVVNFVIPMILGSLAVISPKQNFNTRNARIIPEKND